MEISPRTSVDPYATPNAALRRLQLPASVPKSFVDLTHLGSTDLAVATRDLDTTRESLEKAFNRTSAAVGTLRIVEEHLTRVQELVKTNTAPGASPTTRRQNEREITDLLKTIDETLAKAKYDSLPIFDGKSVVGTSADSMTIPRLDTDRIGKVLTEGKAYSAKDLGRRESLDTTRRRRTAYAAANEVADAALKQVTELREKLSDLGQEKIRPAIGDVAEILASLYTTTADDITSEDALLKLRNLTLQSTGVAAAIGATGWDPKRVEELLS